MVKKNSGFTMIELLTAVVVLGLLMTIAVPTVMDVLNDSKNRTYVDDAIRMTSTFEAEMRKDNMMPIPAPGNCILVNLTYLDNNTFNDAPYGGEYDRIRSFVVAKRVSRTEYKYYPRLVEKLPKGEKGYRGINLTEVNKLYDKNALDVHVKSVSKDKLFDPSTANEATIKGQLNSYGINCGRIIFSEYVPNASDDNLND